MKYLIYNIFHNSNSKIFFLIKKIFIKKLFCVCIIILLILYFTSVGYKFYSCNSKDVIQEMCSLYKNSFITGNMCWFICKNISLTSQSCAYDEPDYRILIHESFNIEIPEKLFDNNGSHLWLENNGFMVTMDYFIEKAIQICYHHYGYINRSLIKSAIFSLADINMDEKISEVESRSTIAFLSNPMAVLNIIGKGSSHIEKTIGFCGGVFIVGKSNTIDVRKWYWLKWHQRAKIVIGLFEFLEELLANEMDIGSAIICPKSLESISYSSNYEFIIPKLASILNANKLCSSNFSSGLPQNLENDNFDLIERVSDQYYLNSLNCSLNNVSSYLCNILRCGLTYKQACSKHAVFLNLFTVCNVIKKFMNFPDRLPALHFLVYLEDCMKIAAQERMDKVVLFTQKMKNFLFKNIENI